MYFPRFFHKEKQKLLTPFFSSLIPFFWDCFIVYFATELSLLYNI